MKEKGKPWFSQVGGHRLIPTATRREPASSGSSSAECVRALTLARGRRWADLPARGPAAWTADRPRRRLASLTSLPVSGHEL